MVTACSESTMNTGGENRAQAHVIRAKNGDFWRCMYKKIGTLVQLEYTHGHPRYTQRSPALHEPGVPHGNHLIKPKSCPFQPFRTRLCCILLFNKTIEYRNWGMMQNKDCKMWYLNCEKDSGLFLS